jgi:hypothetical protein
MSPRRGEHGVVRGMLAGFLHTCLLPVYAVGAIVDVARWAAKPGAQAGLQPGPAPPVKKAAGAGARAPGKSARPARQAWETLDDEEFSGKRKP